MSGSDLISRLIAKSARLRKQAEDLFRRAQELQHEIDAQKPATRKPRPKGKPRRDNEG